jgi:uncharacterized protein YdeI (YjbR/CyaY-like superfamily)
MALTDVPADITQALAADAAAQKAFAGLAPSHRREYLIWIEDARKDETRRRRIAGMVERLKVHGTRRDNGEG